MIRTDDLQVQGLHILQDTEEARFSEDAVQLVSFLRLRPGDRVVDLGAGNGILSILGAAKTGAAFVGVEKQEAQCDLARRSANMNGQEIPFYCMDVADAPNALGDGNFSAAVMNPPYFAPSDGGENASRALARHGGTAALQTFLPAAFRLLKNGGRLFCCYPAEQFVTLSVLLRENRLEPKRARFILPTSRGNPQRVLVEAKKGGKPGILFESGFAWK